MKNFLRFFSADSESMINILLCQPIITSHGLGGGGGGGGGGGHLSASLR